VARWQISGAKPPYIGALLGGASVRHYGRHQWRVGAASRALSGWASVGGRPQGPHGQGGTVVGLPLVRALRRGLAALATVWRGSDRRSATGGHAREGNSASKHVRYRERRGPGFVVVARACTQQSTLRQRLGKRSPDRWATSREEHRWRVGCITHAG
jgi:hypothetical protein